MTLSLGEGLVDAIATYIEANVAAKLVELDAEYGGLTLEVPVATYRGLKSLKNIPNYPALYVVAPEQDLNLMTVDATSAVIEVYPHVNVGILVVDANEENLQLRLYRYGRALVELLLAAQGTFALSNWSLGTAEAWTLDTMSNVLNTQSEGSPFVGEVSLGVRASKIENM